MATNKKSDSKDKKGGSKSPSKAKKTTATKAKQAGEEVEAESSAATPRPAKKAPKPQVKRAPLMEKTFHSTKGEHIGWRLVDAAGQPLGRLSSYIANVLMGKDKPTYTSFADAGDHVVVINAKSVKLTGNKWQDKTYHHHTNYPGGIKSYTAQNLLDNHPERLIQRAVWGMLPKSKGHMARKWYKKLRVFPGTEHPHSAQQPVPAKLPNLGTWENA